MEISRDKIRNDRQICDHIAKMESLDDGKIFSIADFFRVLLRPLREWQVPDGFIWRQGSIIGEYKDAYVLQVGERKKRFH